MSGTSITRAVLIDSEGVGLPCQFNPTTVRVTKSSTWTSHPTRTPSRAPRPQFVGTGAEQLSAKLLFDGFDTLGGASWPVPDAIEQLFTWTCVSADSYNTLTPQPPTIRFKWGQGIDFHGFLMRVNAEFTMFSPEGWPVRATADITLQRIPDDPQGTNPTSGGVPGRRSALLGDCDSLASVAYAEYGDPGLWRAIAIANGIEDPARVPAGARLFVPPWTQAVRLSVTGGDDDAVQ